MRVQINVSMSNEKHHLLFEGGNTGFPRERRHHGDTTASQYGLRARVEPDNRPLEQQSDRRRGIKAAFEVLKGTISPRSAQS